MVERESKKDSILPIRSAEFACSAFTPDQIPPESLPEIAFAGRSNVGKSSLINALLIRKKLAKTSNTPGRTQSINFFIINKAFYFVDLPGYGFAKVPKAMQFQWKVLIERYLGERKSLRMVVQIVDGRHPPNPYDIQLKTWLDVNKIASITVITKIDKVNRGEWEKCIQVCERVLGTDRKEILLFSAVKRIGCENLREIIARVVHREH